MPAPGSRRLESDAPNPMFEANRMSTQVGAVTIPIYLAGEFVEAGTPLEVHDPATGELVGSTWQAGPYGRCTTCRAASSISSWSAEMPFRCPQCDRPGALEIIDH